MTEATTAPEVTSAEEATKEIPTSSHPIVQAALADDTKVIIPFEMTFRKQTDEKSGVTTKRPSIALSIPYPSFNGIVKILEGKDTNPKEYSLLMEAVYGVINNQARELVNTNPDLTAENFPYDQIDFSVIANQPESERKGRGIAKDIWEGFYKDYLEVMPAAINKSAEIVSKQVGIFAQKLNPLKNHEDKKKILPKLLELLGVYANVSKNAEEYTACVEFLTKKGEDFMNADNEANLAKNLGF